MTGRESAKSLYSADLASMEIEDGGSIDYEPADAQARKAARKSLFFLWEAIFMCVCVRFLSTGSNVDGLLD